MGASLSPDPITAPFGPGMLRLILQLEGLSGSISFLAVMTTPPVYWTHFHMLLSHLPLGTQCIQNFLQRPTRMVGSRTHRVAYYTGYPTTVVKACIHLPS